MNSLDTQNSFAGQEAALRTSTTASVDEAVDPTLWKKRWLGRLLIVIGTIGLAVSAFHSPEHSDLIGPTALWSGVSLVAMITLFAGVPGAYHGYIRPIHLKIIDLVWVLASAMAVFIAVVQTSQVLPDMTRTGFAKQLEKARSNGHAMAVQAYLEQCSATPSLSEHQCKDLRFIANALMDEAWLSRFEVAELCPIPWNFDRPPAGYGRNLVGACLNAIQIVVLAEDPVMMDKSNVENWRLAFLLWPHLMMGLVALRVMKSIGEVFWLRST